ncbi:MAG: hypothetical protein JJ899_10050 [Alphaproteobacteria bacterium]|nr:hypothetical protein [Alphaproteobacteria bacterium]
MAPENDQPAGPIIAAFGGIRPMAAKLDIPVSTVQGWKQRDTIPSSRMEEIRRVAEEYELEMPDPAGPDEGPVIDVAAEPASEPEPGPSDAPKTSVPRSGSGSTNTSATADRGASQERSGSGLAMVVALLALLVSLGAAGWLWWSTEGPEAAPDPSVRIAELEARIADLGRGPADPGKEERTSLAREIASLREDVDGLRPPDIEAALAPLRAELDRLAARTSDMGASASIADDPELAGQLAALEAEIQNVTQLAATNMQAMSGGLVEFDVRQRELEERLAALDSRLGSVASDGARQDAAAAEAMALTVSAGQLRRAVERGRPYAEPLARIEAASADTPALAALVARLSGQASGGVATREELAFSFPETAVAILDNAPTGAESGIVDQVLERAQRIVRVRRVGTEAPPDSLDGRIARAEIRLEDGDVAGAIAALEGLEGASAEAAAPWLARARAHVDARDAADAVEDIALERLQAVSGR